MDIVEREALVQRHMANYYGADHLIVANLLRAALTKLAAGYEERIRQLEAERVPEGWQLVPIEPTDAMRKVQTWDFNRFYPPAEIWKAMLAVAPQQQKEGS